MNSATRTARIAAARTAARTGTALNNLQVIREGNACLEIEAAAPAVRTEAAWLLRAARPALVKGAVVDFALECVADESNDVTEAVALAGRVFSALLHGNWSPSRVERDEAIDAALVLFAA